MTVEPGLYLVTPLVDDSDAFGPAMEEACAAVDVVAVLLRFALSDERTLVNRLKILAPIAQRHGAAVIVADPGRDIDLVALATRGGADGAHAYSAERLQDLCERLKEGRNVGAGGVTSKHDAMVAGEMGVDYVMFGEPRPDGSLLPLELVEERAEWWAEIFQVPCVVFAQSLDDVPDLVRTGADFIAIGDIVWTHQDGPGSGIRAVREATKARETSAC